MGFGGRVGLVDHRVSWGEDASARCLQLADQIVWLRQVEEGPRNLSPGSWGLETGLSSWRGLVTHLLVHFVRLQSAFLIFIFSGV